MQVRPRSTMSGRGLTRVWVTTQCWCGRRGPWLRHGRAAVADEARRLPCRQTAASVGRQCAVAAASFSGYRLLLLHPLFQRLAIRKRGWNSRGETAVTSAATPFRPSDQARYWVSRCNLLLEGEIRMRKIIITGLLVAVAALSACADGNDASKANGTTAAPATIATTTETPATSTEAPATIAEAPVTPEYTVAQQNGIRSAESYLEMSGFSRAGLIQQLSSEYGEGFAMADAVFAVDHVAVDWNAEAIESAQSYLEMSGFSRAGLIEQLSSEYGGQFTLEQATYAVGQVGL